MSSYSYLIELRIGTPRWKISDTISKIRKQFNLKNETHKVPHLSLYGAFEINSGCTLNDVKTAIECIAKQHDSLPYLINGWDNRLSKKGGVVSYRIEPSPELISFTKSMKENLLKITRSKNQWDNDPEDTWYHITLAFKLTKFSYQKILKFLGIIEDQSLLFKVKKFLTWILFKKKNTYDPPIKPLLLPVDALRITILHNRLIAAEYDLVTKIWHNRDEAKNWHRYSYTLKKFRTKNRIELTHPNNATKNEIFVIGDLHLGHANIIKYCFRPFLYTDVHEMNEVLINNWNFSIKPEDEVFFIGDLVYGKQQNSPISFFNRLQGKITFIRGNHDEKLCRLLKNCKEYDEKTYHGINFLFIHNPANAPKDFDGWIIHGHVHNNKLNDYPFFDPQNKRINVGAELIKYQPIALSKICDLISQEKEKILTLS